MKKFVQYICFFIAGTSTLFGQDVHLSQFYASDHLLNPAVVGEHTGDFRASFNYRNQWSQINGEALNTFVGSFDKAFRYYSHEIDGGLMIVTDQFSAFETNTTKAFLTGAYAYKLNKNIFRGGIQLGIVSNSTNLNVQTFPEQWDYPNGKFNPNLPTKENSIKSSQMYTDVNIGGNWTRQIKKITIKSGIAVNHINRPKDSYFSVKTERLRARKVLHTEIIYPLNKSFTIHPQFMWMWTTKANELLMGTRLKYKTNHKVIPELNTGLFYRHGVVRTIDAVCIYGGLKYNNFDFGISYDINVSSLHLNVKRPSSIEFSLIYTGLSSKVKYKVIPCSRY